MTPKRGINNASDPQSKQGKRRSYNSLGHTEGAGEWSKQANKPDMTIFGYHPSGKNDMQYRTDQR